MAKKSLGQNFLMHPQTAERIVEAAQVPKGSHILEIGPGTGMLTRVLLEKGYLITAVEADDELAPALMETFASEIKEGKLTILHEDIRSFDPISLGNTYHIVANIPYYLTGEIIRTFLEHVHKPSSMTLMVQKEVAERIARSNGKESVLSISVKAYGEPVYCFTVPKGAFRPAPTVDSAVLLIKNINSTAFPTIEAEKWFFSVLKAGFAHKRKRLAKNLEALASPIIIESAMIATGLDTNIRSEDVSADEWRALSDTLTPR